MVSADGAVLVASATASWTSFADFPSGFNLAEKSRRGAVTLL